MLSLDAHNIVDYFLGLTLIVLTIVDAQIPGARTLFLVCGFGLIVYGLFSDMPLSARKSIPVVLHMTLDGLVAALLITGPWLFGYQDNMNTAEIATHVGVGVVLFLLMAITDQSSTTTWPQVREDILRETDDRPAELAGRR